MAPARILSYFARHRTAANLLLAVLLILGVSAFPNMRAQYFPDVVVDDIRVNVSWEGAGADDVDRAIVDVLEPVLAAINGVSEVTATAREGSARIKLEFEPNWDMSQASDDVETALDAVTGLPDDADDPTVRRSIWWDRVTDVVITGPVGVDQLARFADELSSRLFAAGVTNVTIRGVAAPETIVEVPSINLIRHDLSMADIADAIAAEAEADPAGTISGAQRLRTGTERRGQDIGAIVLKSEPDGTTLTIDDIADVHVDGVDRERAYFVGQDSAISIRVDRSAQGDAIEIQRTVEEVAAEMVTTLPEGVSIDLIRTRAEAISSRLSILLDNGLMGLGLVVLLLFLFLNARTAFWVAAGIPVAMTAAIAMMYAAGLTLNMVSLFALIITLGIVVDDAIVVGEHADHRARRLGEDPATAAERAATRMFSPVFAATITTIIAFFGLMAVGGRFGEMIKDIPFTVIVVLIASLVECFLILPNHMAHSLAHSAKEHWYDWPSRQVNRGFRWVRETLFRPLMAGVIWLRYPVIAGTLLILASQVTLFISGEVQWRFWNPPERASITGNFSMLPGATREDTLDQVRLLQETVAEVEAQYIETYGASPVNYVLAEVGGVSWRGLAGSETKEPDQLGSISIELIDADLRPYSSFQVVGDLQEALRRHPMSETISFRGWRSGPGGNALEVEIFGADTETLKAAAEDLKTRLAAFPEVSALEDSLSYDREELILDLTPRGQALGFDIDALGRILRNRLNGVEAATYPDGTRTAAIRVELPPGEITADFMDRIMLRAEEGAYVPLSDIVSVERRTGFSEIRRENGQRVVTVSGDINEDDPVRAAAVDAALSGEILTDIEERFGVVTARSGLAEEENAFLNDALQGLILCLAGIYLVLAWVFSSWSRPIIVMAIIPFGLVGAIYGHALWDVPLSMFSIVGLIGMTGIIINDSIVLVTTVDEHAKSRALVPSIIDGAADRLRPVLLTTLTTVLGLTPLLYEGSRQAEFLKPTVITLVYGLGFGMVLVLLVVPALLAIQRDFGEATRALRRALRARGPAGRMARGAAIAATAIFVLTVGPVLLRQTPDWLVSALPDTDPLIAALGLFIAGVFAVVVIVWLAAGFAARRTKAGIQPVVQP